MAAAPSLTGDQDQLHSMTLILGQVINKAFGYQISEPEWERLVSMVQTWLDKLPSNVKPFSRSQSVTPSAVGELPCFWFLQDFHGEFRNNSCYYQQLLLLTLEPQLASARQYALIALTILAAFAPLNQLSMLPSVCDDAELITADVSKGDLLETYAIEICGIAFTTNIPSVLVNSFGPIAYCKPLLLTIHSPPPTLSPF